MTRRSWTIDDLVSAVKVTRSIRQVLQKIKLKEAGGNYKQVQDAIREYNINTNHFSGKGWRKGVPIPTVPAIPLRDIMVRNSSFQSHKLKKRLFAAGLKKQKCEECGWHKKSPDGRIPLELDHINGNNRDNRFSNLRVLCPNCHSLKPTHRGRNKRAGVA